MLVIAACVASGMLPHQAGKWKKNMRVDELFNWMVERRFVPKSLDALRGHKV